jgi:hypothetical protein
MNNGHESCREILDTQTMELEVMGEAYYLRHFRKVCSEKSGYIKSMRFKGELRKLKKNSRPTKKQKT